MTDGQTLVDLLLAGRDHGDRTAFAFVPDGSDTVSESIDYATFVDRSLRVAAGLRKHGVGPGTHVGLVALPTIEYVVSVAAILFAGAAAVPVNHLFKRRELVAYLTTGGVTAVIADEAMFGLVADAARDVPGLDLVVATDRIPPGAPPSVASALLSDLEREDAAEPARPGRDDIAVLMHTSGTTGLPKAVVRTHGTYHDFVHLWARSCMRPHDRVFSFMPMYHQAGLLVHWLPAYSLGLPFFQMERFSPLPFWATVRRYGLTTGLFMTPVPMYLLARPEEEDGPHPLEWAFSVVPPDVWKRFQERFGVPMHGGYGSTETTMVSMSGLRDDPPYPDEALDLPLGGSVMGKVLPGWCELRIAGDDEQPVPPLTFGEIQVRGPGVLTEYYRNPEATAAAFTSDGWFKSGDVGYVTEDGRYLLVDRTKNLIRRSGENIAPAEIEEVIMALPAVHEVAVVPVDDETRGQEIRACIVVKPGESLTADEVWSHCAGQLAGFKVPRFVEFRHELPHTPTFKVQKEQLVAGADPSGWIDRLSR